MQHLYNSLRDTLIDGPYKGMTLSYIARTLGDIEYVRDVIEQGLYLSRAYALQCLDRWEEERTYNMLLLTDPEDYINQSE